MFNTMNRYRAFRITQSLLRIAGIAVGFVFALFATLRDLFHTVQVVQDEEHRLHDSDLSGEMNHRTGRLDSGLDPYGWYDQD